MREELLKFYIKLPLVKDFYSQDLMTEEEQSVVLKTYKDRIYKQLWTPKGNLKIANNGYIVNRNQIAYSHFYVFLPKFHLKIATANPQNFVMTA